MELRLSASQTLKHWYFQIITPSAIRIQTVQLSAAQILTVSAAENFNPANCEPDLRLFVPDCSMSSFPVKIMQNNSGEYMLIL